MNKVLVIVSGPTASGKTSLALELAIRYNTEIISADSRQFFKELSIGTAKPEPAELKSVKHHFIDSHSIKESFNAGSFGINALNTLENIFESHQVVVMAGGSGLYIDAVINGMDDFPEVSPEVRSDLNKIYRTEGISALQILLEVKDPETYASVDRNNHRRLIRALEVTLSTGIPYSAFLSNKKNLHEFKTVFCCIDWPREKLYERINERVDAMIKNGLENEARSVIEFKDMNALRTVGYKEMFEYIEGKISLEEAVELIKKNTRNYAKRQITWFKKYNDMIYVQPGEVTPVIERIEQLLND